MSIVTLKKKTQSQYNNVSVGHRQFSLNGTHRSPGWVGQTTLSRSLPEHCLEVQPQEDTVDVAEPIEKLMFKRILFVSI